MCKIIYFKQLKDWSCGAAAMRMVLSSFKIKKSEAEIAKIMGTKKSCGTKNKAFPKIAEKYKLNYVVKRNASVKDLTFYLKKKFRVVVGYREIIDDEGHYAVIKKIDAGKIYLLDPEHGPNYKLSLTIFKKQWNKIQRGDKEKNWFFAVNE